MEGTEKGTFFSRVPLSLFFSLLCAFRCSPYFASAVSLVIFAYCRACGREGNGGGEGSGWSMRSGENAPSSE